MTEPTWWNGADPGEGLSAYTNCYACDREIATPDEAHRHGGRTYCASCYYDLPEIAAQLHIEQAIDEADEDA